MNTCPRSSLLSLLGAALAVSLVGCSPQAAPPAAAPSIAASDVGASPSPLPNSPMSTDPGAERSAVGALAELEVKGRAPKTGYTRDEFGPRWADVDHNGCDTRNDILRRDLTEVTADPQTQDCKVRTGKLVSPYTGATVDFVSGEGTSSDIQIDHVVALSDAWQKGAQQWDPARRGAFANDPLNLRAVDGRSNSAKGDADAATWLPQATDHRCEYVATQIAVKQRYDLWVTEPERETMDRVLQRCPEQQLPTAADTPASPTSAPGVDSPHYARCQDAHDADAAPLHTGQPGYRAELDGDGDGIACGSSR